MAGLDPCFTTSLILSNKQYQATVSPLPLYFLLSVPRLSTGSSQRRFTAWLCLAISKNSTSSSHLRVLHSSGRVALGRTQCGLILNYITQETTEPVHTVNSYTPCQSTITMSLHSSSSTESRGGWSVVAASPCS